MKKIITGAMAALTLGSAAIAGPASARGWYGYHHDNDAGAAIAGGLVGLALGAAIAGSSRQHYYGGYYDRGYYGAPYYGPAYYGGYGGYYGAGYGGVCIGRRTVWDPYWDGYRVRTFRYAC
jgi:hypothetical protein